MGNYITKSAILKYLNKNSKVYDFLKECAETKDGYIYYLSGTTKVLINTPELLNEWVSLHHELYCCINDGYYTDKECWEYLQNNNITDFSSAINNENCKSISEITNYYYFNKIQKEFDKIATELLNNFYNIIK